MKIIETKIKIFFLNRYLSKGKKINNFLLFKILNKNLKYIVLKIIFLKRYINISDY
jgi:hypothetical protein